MDVLAFLVSVSTFSLSVQRMEFKFPTHLVFDSSLQLRRSGSLGFGPVTVTPYCVIYSLPELTELIIISKS